PERLQEFALHVDRPDVDVAARLQMAEIDDGVVAREIARAQPQREELDARDRAVDVGGRAGAEDAEAARTEAGAQGRQEEERADVGPERLARQQEQDPPAREVEGRPGLARQAWQGYGSRHGPELLRMAPDDVARE